MSTVINFRCRTCGPVMDVLPVDVRVVVYGGQVDLASVIVFCPICGVPRFYGPPAITPKITHNLLDAGVERINLAAPEPKPLPPTLAERIRAEQRTQPKELDEHPFTAPPLELEDLATFVTQLNLRNLDVVACAQDVDDRRHRRGKYARKTNPKATA